MQKIVPHLWYDKEAMEAALFYISIFDNSKLIGSTIIENTPSGDAELVRFQLDEQQFAAISAGPYFKFNPSISFMVMCLSIEEVNRKWAALIDGGTSLMPLGEYQFSKRYGWLQDRYGLSWQLIYREGGDSGQLIRPNLLFSHNAIGKTEEALNFYTEVFNDSKVEMISKYGIGEASSTKAKINYAAFQICGANFSAMDNGYDVDYDFNEAISFMVNCKDQTEIDYFWNALSAVPEAEQCGWLKDKFGVSWQIVPEIMDEIMLNGSREEIRRVTSALLKMKKLEIEVLEKARNI